MGIKREIFALTAVLMMSAGGAGAVDMLNAEDEAFVLGKGNVSGQSARVYQTNTKEEALEYAAAAAAETLETNSAVQTENAAAVEAEEADDLVYRRMINACRDERESRLNEEKKLISSARPYDHTAYLSRMFEEIGRCYERVGRAVIARFYGNDEEMLKRFEKKVPTFFVSGADVDFEPQYCGEVCSLNALAEAQEEKFADFRAYLYGLIAEAVETKAANFSGEGDF